ncbi:hypothetical protein LCGC14_1706130 [marine sediment metagenome]|uniref:Uncharacterized protein n=1 Tax=marine sediment metagenome TaxID=412755 RepID=A0A0F9I465_9ZZZZ
MGFLSDLGIGDGLGIGISGQGFLFWGGIILLAFVILIIAGAGIFIYYSHKSKKLSFKNQIPIFAELNGKIKRISIDQAKEIFVPDSNIGLFYLKTNKIYLARPTRAMGKNEYWFSIAENGEWVNFDMSTHPDDNVLAKANYDHRDTRYAYVHLKEIIKKNYKDKALLWWKDPVIMNIIAFIVISVVFTGEMWFLISKVGDLIGQIPGFINSMELVADKMAGAVQNAQNINSGVVTA